MATIDIRAATPTDIPLLLDFIRQLAAHEKRPDAVTATPETLADLLFGARAVARGYLGFLDGKPVAYAIVAERFSSFRAVRMLYIEDILVTNAARGHGLGRRMMQFLAEEALKGGFIALEWSALDYNTEAIAFYERVGGDLETGRLHYELDMAGLQRLAYGEQDDKRTVDGQA